MKSTFQPKSHVPGSSLIESIVAVSVLAVAIPLVFAALAGTGESGLSAHAETRSSWIVQTCLNEIHASRDGKAMFLGTSRPGQPFPSGGGAAALAFSSDGRLIGDISRDAYERGVREINGETVRFIASLRGYHPAEEQAGIPMLNVSITQEYPAVAPAAKRQKIHFHTRVP